MSADDLSNQQNSAKQFTDILSAENPTPGDVDTSQVYANATNAAETLNVEVPVECVETVPDHMALELGNLFKGSGVEPDGKPPMPNKPFSKVRAQ